MHSIRNASNDLSTKFTNRAFSFTRFHLIHWVSPDANPMFHLGGSVTSAPVFAATLAPPPGANNNSSHALSFSVFRWFSSSIMNNLAESNLNRSALFRSGYVLKLHTVFVNQRDISKCVKQDSKYVLTEPEIFFRK